MLGRLLREDLERLYFFEGTPGRKATIAGVIGHVLNARFLPVILCRVAGALYRRRLGLLARVVATVNFVLFGIEIALRCDIGGGLCLPHTVGTVIGAHRIGRNAVIYHGVTLGAKEMDLAYQETTRPVVGDNVVIGSGAKVLGGITIGHNVVVAANALVLCSVPDNTVVGGVPARVLRTAERPATGSDGQSI